MALPSPHIKQAILFSYSQYSTSGDKKKRNKKIFEQPNQHRFATLILLNTSETFSGTTKIDRFSWIKPTDKNFM